MRCSSFGLSLIVWIYEEKRCPCHVTELPALGPLHDLQKVVLYKDTSQSAKSGI